MHPTLIDHERTNGWIIVRASENHLRKPMPHFDYMEVWEDCQKNDVWYHQFITFPPFIIPHFGSSVTVFHTFDQAKRFVKMFEGQWKSETTAFFITPVDLKPNFNPRTVAMSHKVNHNGIAFVYKGFKSDFLPKEVTERHAVVLVRVEDSFYTYLTDGTPTAIQQICQFHHDIFGIVIDPEKDMVITNPSKLTNKQLLQDVDPK